MAQRITIDPITRIEGHLRIDAEVDGGKVTKAWSSGQMWRGIETILKGRDPRDAWLFTQRICGVCTTVHALASVRAVENALKLEVPINAQYIRNIVMAIHALQDHIVHFYVLSALDWVDVVSALSADPKKTAALANSLSEWPNNSAKRFAAVQGKVKALVDSGQLGPFANGYWGHPAYKLPPEVNLIGLAHYLEALEWQKEMVKIHAIFGGKNPHPNYLVGGVPCSINLEEVNAINTERLNKVAQILKEGTEFIEQVYLPDLMAIASFYKDWGAIGGGLKNYLSYGDLPTKGYNNPDFFKFPRGAILDRNLNEVHDVNPRDKSEIQEFVQRSWYSYKDGDDQGKHPFDGETKYNYNGPQPPFEYLNIEDKYSWLKTPRWKGNPMEVGPLARILIAYAKGDEDVKEIVHEALAKLDVPITALFSTLGRTAARGLETKLIAHWTKGFYDELINNIKTGNRNTFNPEKWEPETWPAEAEGVGMTEAPRGALAHWIRIKDKKIDKYQLVVPSTWNASPKDPNNQRSAYEEALIGTPIADKEQPVEILRTIHSFDPCIACAVHLYDPSGKLINKLKIQ
ncbi:MAG: nickel-dependent hydrogenase large subunit [Desulfocapsa sp.]|nr:nickel-dependent hydrogenase large subunit [Desulfocapsa sp.]